MKGSSMRRRGGRRSTSVERNVMQRRIGRRHGRGQPMKALRIMEAKRRGSTAVAVIAIVATVIVVTAAAMDLPKAPIMVGGVDGRRVISTEDLDIRNIT
jgi:hypothetical protein